jgi:hypothetical protein
MARPAQAPQPEPEEVDGNVSDGSSLTTEIADDLPQLQVEVTDETEPDVIEIEPVSVVDTTAELLGRAKPRAPRARAGRSSAATATPAPAPRGRTTTQRKPAGKKPAAKKPAPRSRKAANKNDDDFGNR